MSFARVLAVGAHPDDIEFFAGAALAALAQGGAALTLVVCTDGAQGGPEAGAALARRREEEARRAAAALGAAECVLLGRRDGELEADAALRCALVREIRRTRPDLVLGHDPSTLWVTQEGVARLGHSDHRAAGQAVLDAVYPRAFLPGFQPELAAEGLSPWFVRELWLFDTGQPDHFVRLAGAVAAKRAALGCHASQHWAGLVEEAERLAASFSAAAGGPAEAFRRLRLL